MMIEQTNATLAQVLDQLEADTELPNQRKRDLISSINRISRYLARPPEDITVLSRQRPPRRQMVCLHNSCKNRHCPKCQGPAARDWMAARAADLLPVEYFHVVFTLPAGIAQIALRLGLSAGASDDPVFRGHSSGYQQSGHRLRHNFLATTV